MYDFDFLIHFACFLFNMWIIHSSVNRIFGYRLSRGSLLHANEEARHRINVSRFYVSEARRLVENKHAIAQNIDEIVTSDRKGRFGFQGIDGEIKSLLRTDSELLRLNLFSGNGDSISAPGSTEGACSFQRKQGYAISANVFLAVASAVLSVGIFISAVS